jgi:hypothetical protein
VSLSPLEVFRGLEPGPRLLIELLAAAHDELEPGELGRCAAPDFDGVRGLLMPLQALEARGLLELGDRLVLAPGLAEPVRRALIARGRFEPLAARVATAVPAPRGAWAWRKVRAGTLRRELRRALVAEDWDAFRELSRCWPEPPSRLGPRPALERWLDGPLEASLLRRLPPDLAGPALEAISLARAARMEPDIPLLPAAHQLWQAHPRETLLARALGREALLAGELELAAVVALPKGECGGMAGMASLIVGELGPAVRRYARALALRRKREGRGVKRLAGPEGALQPLPYLLHHSEQRRQQGARLLAAAPAEGPEQALFEGHAWLTLLSDPEARAALAPRAPPAHPLALLVASVACRHADLPLDSGRLEAGRDRAWTCGHAWLAGELEVLLSADPRRAAPGARPLAAHLPRGLDGGDPSVQPTPARPALPPGWRLHRQEEAGGSLREVPTQSQVLLRMIPSGPGVLAIPRVRPFGRIGPAFPPGSGERAPMIRVGSELLQVQRDLEAERASLDALLAVLPSLAEALDRGDARYLEGVEQTLGLLEELERAGRPAELEWPEGEPLRLRALLGPEDLHLAARGRGDWFAAEGELRVDGQRVLELRELLDQQRRGRRRFLRLEDGQYLALSAALQDQLERLGRLLGGGADGELGLSRLAAPALEPLLAQAGSSERDESFDLQLAALAEAAEREQAVPRGLRAELRPYQRRGFAWLARLAELGAGACLADEMGLGKTVQVLALLLHRAWLGPALVVAPTSVCGSWVEQARRFAPDLRVLRLGEGDRASQLDAAGPSDLVVCSYGLLQAERERLSSLRWATAVLDEAQAIKNPDTQRHQAACSLQAEQRVVTTGTPVENHLGELWALMRFLEPGLLGSWEAFRFSFAEPIEAGLSQPLEQLRQLVLPFVLRRTKAAVLAELPPRTEQLLEVELHPEERALYTALREQAEELLDALDEPQPLQILAQLTRLRMACCHPSLVLEGDAVPASAKLEAFGELVEQLRAGGHRALVFSQFVRHLAILRAWLDARGVRYRYLDGGTPAGQRDRAVRAFQEGDGDLFLISLRAGGFGLNLTAADAVIHMDPWWNPAVEDQASDRVHRIGQRRPVTVYRLVAQGTVEEKILALHERKRELAQQLLAGSDAAARLSAAELMALIRDDAP